MKPLQMYFQCWVEVTKQSPYRDQWLSDETYFRAVKAQFPTLEALGFDRALINRAISNCGKNNRLQRTKVDCLLSVYLESPISLSTS
jgi:hypothetical protein